MSVKGLVTLTANVVNVTKIRYIAGQVAVRLEVAANYVMLMPFSVIVNTLDLTMSSFIMSNDLDLMFM